MVKKITCTAMVLALAAWLAVIPLGLPAASAESFKDTAGHWSGQAVEKAYALGLMTGYPGGVFYPEGPVSRLEAIAIVINAMGLEEQAKTLDYKNSGIALPQGMFWGQGYLVVAVKNGLLDKNSLYKLEYKNPIPRYEVATLIAVALRDKLAGKGGDIQKLNFTDSGEIYFNSQVDYRQYVADVTQNGIMQGLENNRFGPNDTMKRGQMAALMAGTVMDGWFEYGTSRIITGTLMAVDSTSGITTISKSDGNTISRVTDSNTVIYKGSQNTILTDIGLGSTVLAISGNDAKISYMEAGGTTANPPGNSETGAGAEFTGKIADRFLTGSALLKIKNSYQEQIYPLAASVTVTDGVNVKDLSYLVDGTYVTAKIRDNAIYSIWILPSEEVEGEVTSVDSRSLTIKLDSGVSRVFTVKSGEVKITRGGSVLPFSDLKDGDRVRVVSVMGEARDIMLAGDSSYIEAQVRTVDSFYWMITLLEDNGRRKEYEVKLGAPIRKGDDYVRLDKLEQGDQVRFKLGVDGKITEIDAVGMSVRSLSGMVTGLRTGSSPYIYIDSERYYISSRPNITRNGEKADLNDIMIGAEATLELDKDDIVLEIDIEDEDAVVEGTVTEVSEGSNRITIEQSSGREFTLRVSSDCSFRDMTSSSYNINELDDIEEGWDVKLYLENNRVKSIRVTDT